MNTDSEYLKYAKSHGPNIEWLNVDNWTPLAFAASHGYTNSVKYLISEGAQINDIYEDPRCSQFGSMIGATGRPHTIPYYSQVSMTSGTIMQNYGFTDSKEIDWSTQHAHIFYSIKNTPMRYSIMNHHDSVVKVLFQEYKKYFMKIKEILKYLGLENIHFVSRRIIGVEILDSDLRNWCYG